MIQYITEEVKLPNIQKSKVNRWIKDTAAVYNKKAGEIVFIFCNDEKILEVNKKYLQHDYFTDIITFDYSEGSIISGDIFISVDTVTGNAKDFGVSFEDEIHRIMIHGILHLCGQDDKTDESRKIMTHKENLALQKLSVF